MPSSDSLPAPHVTPARALVTGGSGFLGRHVVKKLADAGVHLTVLGRSESGSRSSQVDLTAPALRLTRDGFDVVYHLAGLAHRVPRTEVEHARFDIVNVQGTGNLLRALERQPRLPSSVVFTSSVAVYGVSEGTLLDESTPRRATDPYGLSKRRAEDAILEWSSRHGVRATIVRLPVVIGRGTPGNFGALVRAMTSGVYVGIGPGSARRSMVLAEDVADVLPRISGIGGTYHLTDGDHPSYAELEAAIAAALGRRHVVRLPTAWARAGATLGDLVERVTGLDVRFDSRILQKMTSTLTFSDARARAAVGWNPSRVLDRVAQVVES